MTTLNSNDPSIQSAAQQAMQPRIDKCRAIMDGVDAVREERTTYLPQLEGESTDRYNVRLQLGDLDPAFEQTVNAAKGLILQTEPTFEPDMPKEVSEVLWENVDGAGTHGTVFSDALIESALVDDVAGIFTDFTRADSPHLDRSLASAAAEDPTAPLDSADEEALGLRPYWVLVKSDEMPNPRYRIVNGLRTLVRFVRKEVVEEDDGDFGTKTVTNYRVYRRSGKTVTAALYRKDEGDALPRLIGKPITMQNCTQIPWSPMKLSEKPTLEALADLVLSCWRTSNGMESLETLGFVPTMVRIGATADENGNYPPITTGPGNNIEAPHIEGIQQPIYWTSPDVSVLEPAAKSLDRKQRMIAVINGAFFGLDTNGVESAAAKKQKARGGNATVSTVARAYKDCIEMAGGHACMFLGKKPGGINVKLTFEDVLMDASTMGAIGNLVQLGFPVEMAVMMLQEGGRLPKHTNVADLAAQWREGQGMLRDAKALSDALAGNTNNPNDQPSDQVTA